MVRPHKFALACRPQCDPALRCGATRARYYGLLSSFSRELSRILVIRGGAIGDFILTLPALKALRDANPRAHIEILGYEHIAALAKNRFYAQNVRSIEYAALSTFFARNPTLPDDLARYFSSFDLIISYLYDPDE